MRPEYGASSRVVREIAGALVLSTYHVHSLLRDYRKAVAETYEWPIDKGSAKKFARRAADRLRRLPPFDENEYVAVSVEREARRAPSIIPLDFVTVLSDDGRNFIVGAPWGYSNQVDCFGPVIKEWRPD